MFRPGYALDKGSFTVEISMIFTLIVMIVFTLLFTFLYMQQKAYLVSAAAYAAQQGAELWRDSSRSMENGEASGAGDREPVGYRIFDNLLLSEKTFEGYLAEETGEDGRPQLVLKMDTGDGLPGKKIAIIGEALGKRMRYSALRPEETRVRLNYSNNGLNGRLTVEIIQEIKVPLGGMKRFFDGKATLSLVGSATAKVSEPAEYIRNIDLAVELSKKLGDELDLMSLLDRLKTKVKK
ncbi:MAG TPA: hypothetical protein VN580_06400 [Clostridia bacterium]|nr:hypothetical protein [Clostridia bacterium]